MNNTGDVILVPFPFSELQNYKVRPAVVICETKDKFKDLVVSAISSSVPAKLTENEIIVKPDELNNLRAVSVVKVDRIFTASSARIITKLGKLDVASIRLFKEKFKKLID